MLTLRPAQAADEAAVVALWQACELVVSHNDPAADFRLARGRSNSDVLIAVDPQDVVVGAVMVGHDGHRGWIYYLAADPRRRRQGIGRKLVEAAELWLDARGIPKLQLMIRETHEPQNDNADPFLPAFDEKNFGYCKHTLRIAKAAVQDPWMERDDP